MTATTAERGEVNSSWWDRFAATAVVIVTAVVLEMRELYSSITFALAEIMRVMVVTVNSEHFLREVVIPFVYYPAKLSIVTLHSASLSRTTVVIVVAAATVIITIAIRAIKDAMQA